MDLLPPGEKFGLEALENGTGGSKRCRFRRPLDLQYGLLRQLDSFRHSNILTDVVFKVGAREIPAHKCIVSSCCSYFERMFISPGFEEGKSASVTLNEVDEVAFEKIIDYMYTNEIIIEDKTVQQLLPIACMLQLSDIQKACCEHLKDRLDPSNCLGIKRFADTHSCVDLMQAATSFTQARFQEVVDSDEFCALQQDQLVELISSDELNVRGEESVYDAVLRWIKHDLDGRKGCLAGLLEHVRFPLMSPKFLVSTVSTDQLIKSSEYAWSLIDEAKNYLLLPQERPLMQSIRTKPRKSTRSGEVLYAVGGWCSGDAIATCERFNPINQEWRMVAPMSKRRCGVGIAVLNDLIYAIGGHDGQTYLNTVERYDPKTNQWACDVPPTSSSRTSVAVTVLNNQIFAIGGQDGISCLNYVEKYDLEVGKWTKVQPMNSRRLGAGVAVLGGYLYAIGGSDGSVPLNTVERYSSETNKWTYVAPMCTRRKHLGVAVHQNQIWAVGGRDDNAELSSVEVYNPEVNNWRPCVHMISRRSGVGLAVLNGSLMAVGGFDGSTYLKTVEIFDNESNCWRLSTSMNYRRLGGGLGVLRLPQSDMEFTENAPSTSNNTASTSDAVKQENNNTNQQQPPSTYSAGRQPNITSSCAPPPAPPSDNLDNDK